MPQQVSPFLEGKYGWSYGENGWNLGADENWLKFSYLHDGNVDSIVSSLPAASNGVAHFLTTDNRFYFAVGTTWYSSPCPKWFIFKIKSTGIFWQFDGSTAVEISNPTQANAALEALQDVVDTLGSAAFQPTTSFATPAQLDIVSAQANDYTDALRADVFAKFNYIVDVKDFGAVGDYNPSIITGTDNTTAFQDAIDELVSRGGGTLYVPPGYYLVAGELTAANVPIRIKGDSQDTSIIQSNTADADLFTLTSTNGRKVNTHGGALVCLTVEDISFGATAFPRSAIQMIVSDDNIAVIPQLVIKNVQIKSVNFTQAGFKYGIYGENVAGTFIDGFIYDGDEFHHNDGSGAFVTESGIRLTGSTLAIDNRNNPTHFWQNIVIIAANKAIHIDDWYEGIYINNFELVFSNYGIHHDADPTRGGTDLVLTGGHINTYLRGIAANNVQTLRLTSVEMLRQYGGPTEYRACDLQLCNNFEWNGGRSYSFIASPAANEFGVVMLDCNDFKIRGVSFNDLKSAYVISDSCTIGSIDDCTFAAPTDAAIQITNGSTDISVTNNKFFGVKAGSNRFMIALDSSTARCQIDENMDDGTPDILIVNNSNNNRIGINYGVGTGYALFTNGDTTPQVDSVGARAFSTNNAGATSVQGFDGGFVGMLMTLFAGDANTTLVHAGTGTVPLALAGAVNALMPVGSSMQFVRTDTVWREVSRSF